MQFGAQKDDIKKIIGDLERDGGGGERAQDAKKRLLKEKDMLNREMIEIELQVDKVKKKILELERKSGATENRLAELRKVVSESPMIEIRMAEVQGMIDELDEVSDGDDK